MTGMENFEAFAKYLPNFLFILLRVSIFFSVIPFFSSKMFPPTFKIGFAIALALVLTPIVEFRIAERSIPLLVMKEIIFSMVLGLSVRFIFMAIDMAAQIVSNAIGLSIASVFNPEIGQSTDLARFQGLVMMMLFLAMNAHHELIYIFVRSYEILPAGQADIQRLAAEGISLGGKVFVIAVKVAAPVAVGMLIVHIMMGFISKAAPQMNIFFVGFPVYILLGFIILFLSFPVFVHLLEGSFIEMKDEMNRIVSIAGG